MSKAHQPLPWRIIHGHPHDYDGKPVITAGRSDVAKANRALIVRAANMHHELVEALKSARGLLFGGATGEEIAALDAVIAKAGEDAS